MQRCLVLTDATSIFHLMLPSLLHSDHTVNHKFSENGLTH